MTAELELRQPDPQPSAIPAKLAYAQALANSGLLPAAYRKNPANILWAMEYGDMLGLTSMAAITGVHVIEGKPTASAGLISALVRRAGHKLRVAGNGKHATCQIVRCDDPGHVFEVTWTLRKNADDNPSAEEAKLLSKDVWQKYPAAMLKSRAITQCARDACEEALFGLHYTPEELGADVDGDGEPVGQAVVTVDGSGTDDDPWYVRPAPQDQPAPAEDTQPWTVERALEEAASFKTEGAGFTLFDEAADHHKAGDCTREEQDKIQNKIRVRIQDRRKEAARRILAPLIDGNPWRDKILDELGGDFEARESLTEVQQQLGRGEIDDGTAEMLSRAIVAMRPRAALKDPQAAA